VKTAMTGINIRLFLLWIINAMGMNALFRVINRDKAIILWYHGICDDGFDLLKGYDERHISRSCFREQLAYLKRKGYSFVSMTELVNTVKNKGRLGKKVVLTFDDGFRNIVENAYPIMREFNAKGCFYLVTDLIVADKLLWTDYVETVIRSQEPGHFQFDFKGEKFTYILTDKKSCEYAMKDIKAKLRNIPNPEMLEHFKQLGDVQTENIPKEFIIANWDEIKALDTNILEIGSHTRSHPNCTNLTSNKELEDEIHRSKKDIEDIIGREVEHFSYPAGSFNQEVIDMVIQGGYKSAVTIKNGFVDIHSELYQLKRIDPDENPLMFKSRISGTTSVLRRIRAIIRSIYKPFARPAVKGRD
jgi:peptidoglycan/xylan/chitin deacetylase (PgdA/CDA1 family)